MSRIWNKGWKVGALVVAIVLIPTAALAAIGTFSTATTTPAVTGTSSSAAADAKGVYGNQTGGGPNTRYGVYGQANGSAGIGVAGQGAKYGVYSNGTLGVAPGRSLSCTACIGGTALKAGSVGSSALQEGSVGVSALWTAAQTDVLQSGQSESGVFGAGDTATWIFAAMTYARPLAAPIANIWDTSTGANVNCPGPGSAAAGWLCLYTTANAATSKNAVVNAASGVVYFWQPAGPSPYVDGTYTVTAP